MTPTHDDLTQRALEMAVILDARVPLAPGMGYLVSIDNTHLAAAAELLRALVEDRKRLRATISGMKEKLTELCGIGKDERNFVSMWYDAEEENIQLRAAITSQENE